MSKGTGFLHSTKVAPYVFILIPVVLIFGLIAYPLFRAFYVSMFDWPLIATNRKFIGLANYVNLVSDRAFLAAFKHTIIFAVSYVVISLVFGLVIALVVHRLPSRLQNFAKSLYFLPVIASIVPVSIAFKWLLGSTPSAPINYYLSFLGIEPVRWLTSPELAMPSVIGVTIWKNTGFIMIIYLAGLLGIPESYYEAARIDGANGFQTFRRITLPLLRNTTVFLTVTGFIGSFQAFTQLFVLVGSGPGGSTTVLGYEIYFRGFNSYQMGSASAMGFVMFFFILLATLIQLRYFGGERTEA